MHTTQQTHLAASSTIPANLKHAISEGGVLRGDRRTVLNPSKPFLSHETACGFSGSTHVLILLQDSPGRIDGGRISASSARG